MSENAEAPRPRRPRKVTAMISPELHAKFLMAKLTSGKTLNTLMIEAIELIVTHYRPPRKP
jgi:predicted HicB family RNase H-like nuclease